MNPLSNIPGAARGLALAVTLAGTLSSSPRREIRVEAPNPADWAADPARVGGPVGRGRSLDSNLAPGRAAEGSGQSDGERQPAGSAGDVREGVHVSSLVRAWPLVLLD